MNTPGTDLEKSIIADQKFKNKFLSPRYLEIYNILDIAFGAILVLVWLVIYSKKPLYEVDLYFFNICFGYAVLSLIKSILISRSWSFKLFYALVLSVTSYAIYVFNFGN